MSIFDINEVDVTYKFIRHDIEILNNDPQKKEQFINDFIDFFLDIAFSEFEDLRETIGNIMEDKQVDEDEKHLIRNTLYRVLNGSDNTSEHLKGTVGEFLLCYFYNKLNGDFLFDLPPKARTSAEPGMDYLVFTGNEQDKNTIKGTFYEIKTTANEANTMTSKILKFYTPNGSFSQNLLDQVGKAKEAFKYRGDSNLKDVIKNMHRSYMNKTPEFCIGACITTTEGLPGKTIFRNFEDSFDGLTKEQRKVKFIFVEFLKEIIKGFEEKIWKKL